jgi:hypothetical protein
MVNREFIVKKPYFWNSLALYQKIKYYGENMNQHYSKYVDKLEAKEIVKHVCPDLKTTTVIKILDDPYDINVDDLLDNRIIKSSHGSGWNIVISNETKANVPLIHNTLKDWNKVYSFKEKQYAFIKPRFFIEDVIDDKYYGKNGNAIVYMIRCIYGKPITVSPFLKNTHQISNYDINWNLIYKNELPHIEKPVHFDKMLKYAELLSSPFEFVRIDFHVDKNDDIYFSEFTFTPRAGMAVFSHEIEKKLGILWI